MEAIVRGLVHGAGAKSPLLSKYALRDGSLLHRGTVRRQKAEENAQRYPDLAHPRPAGGVGMIQRIAALMEGLTIPDIAGRAASTPPTFDSLLGTGGDRRPVKPPPPKSGVLSKLRWRWRALQLHNPRRAAAIAPRGL